MRRSHGSDASSTSSPLPDTLTILELVSLSGEVGDEHRFESHTYEVSEGEGERKVVWHCNGKAVKHLIPKGKVPYTWHSKAFPAKQNCVSFRDTDGRTVIPHKFVLGEATGNFYVPQFVPTYKFPSKTESDRFQRSVRQRELLRTFDTNVISKINGWRKTRTELAQTQQLKLWRRLDEVTFTFFANSESVIKKKHFEPDIRWFRQEAELQDSSCLVIVFNRPQKPEQKNTHSENSKKRRKSSHGSFHFLRKKEKPESSSCSTHPSTSPPTVPLPAFPTKVLLHEQELVVKEEFLEWGSLAINFTNAGDADKFTRACLRAHHASPVPPHEQVVLLERGRPPPFRNPFEEANNSGNDVSRNPSSPVSPSIAPHHENFLDDAIRNQPTRNAAAEEWWKGLLYHRNKIFPHGIPDGVLPVRIAVLDTGVDATNRYIQKNWRRPTQVQNVEDFPDNGYRDFLSEQDDVAVLVDHQNGYEREVVQAILSPLRERPEDKPEDIHGHGTHVAGIVLQLAPDAVLFVARVLEEKASGDVDIGQAARRVALAVLYATEVWKVQIISLSIGFRRNKMTEDDVVILRNALHYARQAKVVTFAAASNSGNREKLAFPASQHRLVICVNSSDGNGGKSSFNPQSQPQQHNYSILGEYVRSTWLQEVYSDSVEKDADGTAWKYDRGTSIATPIAASVAALILQFGRVYGVNRCSELESPEGILQILSKMSKQTSHGFYDIVPWEDVFNSSWNPREIKGIIVRALEDM